MCDMTHSYVWHDPLICVAWLISRMWMSHVTHETHSYVSHDSFICVTRLIHTCGMTHTYVYTTHSYMWHDPFICVARLIHFCGMTHTYEWYGGFMCVTWHSFHHTGWRRPAGCLKLPVIFRKRATNYRALLRKMPYKDKASYDSTPPCMSHVARATSRKCMRIHSVIFVHATSGQRSDDKILGLFCKRAL